MATFVKRLTETARMPTLGSRHAAGLDLYADEALTLEPGQLRLVRTGIAVAIPPHLVGLIWPRSGMAVKGVTVFRDSTTDAGVIDADYRGEVRVLLVNLSDEPVAIQRGMRIAQMLIQPVFPAVVEVDSLPPTERGEDGFGSTGS